jgi:hypothetical protein
VIDPSVFKNKQGGILKFKEGGQETKVTARSSEIKTLPKINNTSKQNSEK